MVTGALLTFVMYTYWVGLVVPTVCRPKFNEVADNASPVALPLTVPVPDNATLPLMVTLPLLEMLRAPVSRPTVVGRKVTLTEQLDPGDSWFGQLFSSVKSAVALEIVMGAVSSP